MLQDTVLNMGNAIGQLQYERDQVRYHYEQLKAILTAAAAAAPAPTPTTTPAPVQTPPPPQDEEMEPQEGVPTEEEPQEAQEVETPATNTRSKKRTDGATTFAALP